MSANWRPKSVRVRLALWYAGSLGVLLLLYAAGVFTFLERNLFRELERRLHDDFEVAEEMLEVRPDGEVRWRVQGHAEEHGEEEGWVEVWNLDGKPLYRSKSFARARVDPSLLPLPQGSTGYSSLALPDGSRVRVLTDRYPLGDVSVVIRVGRSEERLRHELWELLGLLALGFVIAVGAAGVSGYVLARRALAPVGRMAEQAVKVTADRLGERLPVANPDDELGQLASVFNQTFARLEKSFEQLRRFTADASHELRTPLTAIRSVGEVGLREPRDERSYRDIIGSMLEEVDRLARLVEQLLMLSRADAGHVKLSREPVDLAELAREVAEHLAVLAEEKKQVIQVGDDGVVMTEVDRLVLRQALINLYDNAIKYSPERSAISVSVRAKDLSAILEVKDSGIGIPRESQKHVFERFYRVDKGRSRGLGGTGLGLSIARWAVEVHGGLIEFESEVGKGSTFRIVLPLAEKGSGAEATSS
ncbi:MAG: HAMP domain-containing protein [Planctomycetes bacterium]|nr:HAMP domain-containing protein [Planctomycetota bacterium]